MYEFLLRNTAVAPTAGAHKAFARRCARTFRTPGPDAHHAWLLAEAARLRRLGALLTASDFARAARALRLGEI